MKVFISYSSQNNKTAQYIKDFLDTIQIDSFMAEDNIKVASEWKNTIVKELELCDVFIPLLSNEFKASLWCSQEIGIAYILKKKFIPISLDDTQPYGFIDHIQSKSITELGPLLIVSEGLMECERPAGVKCFLKLLETSGSYEYSEKSGKIYKTMEPYFTEFNNDDLNTIVQLSIDNSQIWYSSECSTKYIPRLLEKRKNDIASDLYKKLNYQITERKSYKKNEVNL